MEGRGQRDRRVLGKYTSFTITQSVVHQGGLAVGVSPLDPLWCGFANLTPGRGQAVDGVWMDDAAERAAIGPLRFTASGRRFRV